MGVAVFQERLIAFKLFLSDSEPQYALYYCKFQYLESSTKFSGLNQLLTFLIFTNFHENQALIYITHFSNRV